MTNLENTVESTVDRTFIWDMKSIFKFTDIRVNTVFMTKKKMNFVCVLSCSWFDSEMQKPSFQIIKNKLKDLFEQDQNYILKITYLWWVTHNYFEPQF